MFLMNRRNIFSVSLGLEVFNSTNPNIKDNYNASVKNVGKGAGIVAQQ